MSPFINTQYRYSEKINTYTESPTITTSTPPFVSTYYFENTIQAMFTFSDQMFTQSDQIFEKQQAIFA